MAHGAQSQVQSCEKAASPDSNSPAQGALSLHDLEIRKIRKRGVALPREPVPLSEEVRKECVWPDHLKHGKGGRE